MTFQEAWNVRSSSHSTGELMRERWENLLVPLPDLEHTAWAYALTYRVHQEEARLADVFLFEKCEVAKSTSTPIQYRPALDYEAEIALLLQRGEPERFGFLFANDLTDRAAQIRTFNRRNPVPGFSAAKSFPGALLVGPLLLIGGADHWSELEVRLEVNGSLRQHVRACDCLMTPREFYQQIFTSADVDDWALVLTGTCGGTIFQSPTKWQRLHLLARNGFSVARAREAWLRRFQFLRVGDRLEMKSEILGTSHATIVESPQ